MSGLNVSTILDIEKLNHLVVEGFISQEVHPSGELSIYCSNDKADKEWGIGDWPDEALIAQGLILNRNYDIVARPIPKFFQWSEFEGVIPTDLPFKIQQFVDGTLCFMYLGVDGKPAMATKNSFSLVETFIANEMFQKMYSNEGIKEILATHTPCFQMISSEIPSWVNSYEEDCLVFLTAINIVSGRELPKHDEMHWTKMLGIPSLWDGPRIHEIQSIAGIEEAFIMDTHSNGDGVIVIYSNGMRLKMNFEQLVGLQRVGPGIVSPKIIWEYLKNDRKLYNLFDSLPDEFIAWAEDVEEDLTKKYTYLKAAIGGEYFDIFNEISKSNLSVESFNKAFAEKAKTSEYSAFLFCKKNNQDVDSLIWNHIKPKFSNPYKVATNIKLSEKLIKI